MMRLSEEEVKALETYRFSSEAADVSSSMLLAWLLNDDGQLAKYVAHVHAEMGRQTTRLPLRCSSSA
nr:hypothetical protein [Geobacillus sp. JS12]